MTTDSNHHPSAHGEPRLRAAAAARAAGLPVATLRVWERRYALSGAARAPSGHRLYSFADVERLRWIRHLAGRGHAVGTLAPLSLAALRALAGAATAEAPPPLAGDASAGTLWVVGAHALPRLRRAAPALVADAVFADLESAEAAAGSAAVPRLVVRTPALQDDLAERVLALMARLQSRRVLLLFAFGPEAAADRLAAAGVAVRREPVAAADLAHWLGAADAQGAITVASPLPAHAEAGAGAARRFDDETLVRLASARSTIACECPRHLAELVVQLAGFEAYSRDCAARDAADRALHERIGRAAARARAGLEAALAEVVAAEGL